MPDLHVTSTVEIDVDHATVRRQFGDVAHHAATHVHRGVVFEVITDDGARCHYRQTSKVGPISLSQEMELDRVDDGPLVNRIVKGQFTGGSLSLHRRTGRRRSLDRHRRAPSTGVGTDAIAGADAPVPGHQAAESRPRRGQGRPGERTLHR